jgi:hypothetical protein
MTYLNILSPISNGRSEENHCHINGFEVLTAVNMSMVDFWVDAVWTCM